MKTRPNRIVPTPTVTYVTSHKFRTEIDQHFENGCLLCLGFTYAAFHEPGTLLVNIDIVFCVSKGSRYGGKED